MIIIWVAYFGWSRFAFTLVWHCTTQCIYSVIKSILCFLNVLPGHQWFVITALAFCVSFFGQCLSLVLFIPLSPGLYSFISILLWFCSCQLVTFCVPCEFLQFCPACLSVLCYPHHPCPVFFLPHLLNHFVTWSSLLGSLLTSGGLYFQISPYLYIPVCSLICRQIIAYVSGPVLVSCLMPACCLCLLLFASRTQSKYLKSVIVLWFLYLCPPVPLPVT